MTTNSEVKDSHDRYANVEIETVSAASAGENAPPKQLGPATIESHRITNIRVNANGITGGGPIPANAVAETTPQK